MEHAFSYFSKKQQESNQPQLWKNSERFYKQNDDDLAKFEAYHATAINKASSYFINKVDDKYIIDYETEGFINEDQYLDHDGNPLSNLWETY